MFYGFHVFMDVGVGIQVSMGVVAEMGLQHLLYFRNGFMVIAADKQDLNPIAGGKKKQLVDVFQVREHSERICVVLANLCKVLPNFYRRRLMIHTDNNDVRHVDSYLTKTV
jgi:hypothetical protein